VFPTAPVKPFTEYDVNVLEGTHFNTAALDGIMVVGEKKISKQCFVSQPFAMRGRSSYVISKLYDMSMASIPAVNETEIDMVI
jgi:hypothetical protein